MITLIETLVFGFSCKRFFVALSPTHLTISVNIVSTKESAVDSSLAYVYIYIHASFQPVRSGMFIGYATRRAVCGLVCHDLLFVRCNCNFSRPPLRAVFLHQRGEIILA